MKITSVTVHWSPLTPDQRKLVHKTIEDFEFPRQLAEPTSMDLVFDSGGFCMKCEMNGARSSLYFGVGDAEHHILKLHLSCMVGQLVTTMLAKINGCEE